MKTYKELIKEMEGGVPANATGAAVAIPSNGEDPVMRKTKKPPLLRRKKPIQ